MRPQYTFIKKHKREQKWREDNKISLWSDHQRPCLAARGQMNFKVVQF